MKNKLDGRGIHRYSSVSRGGCSTALLKFYIYKRLLYYNDKDCELSYLMKDGRMTKKEAMQRLEIEGCVNGEATQTICDQVTIDYLSFLRHIA